MGNALDTSESEPVEHTTPGLDNNIKKYLCVSVRPIGEKIIHSAYGDWVLGLDGVVPYLCWRPTSPHWAGMRTTNVYWDRDPDSIVFIMDNACVVQVWLDGHLLRFCVSCGVNAYYSHFDR